MGERPGESGEERGESGREIGQSGEERERVGESGEERGESGREIGQSGEERERVGERVGKKGREWGMGNYGTYIVASHQPIGSSTAQEQALTKSLNREEEISHMVRHRYLRGEGWIVVGVLYTAAHSVSLTPEW